MSLYPWAWYPFYSWLYEFLENVQIESVTADADKGGWEASLSTYQETDAIEKWQLVELPFRFWSVGWDEELRTALVGHTLPLGFEFDFLSSLARFSIATSNRFLEGMAVQGIGFRDRSLGGTSAHDIVGLRLGHIVKHILEQHCNISIWTNPEGWVDTSDIDVTNSSRVSRYNFHATNNAWSALQQVARNEYYYLYFSRDNAVHYGPHPMFSVVLPTPVMEFTADFCNGRPSVTVHSTKKTSQVTLKASDFNGTVYTSTYPATPAAEGQPKSETRIRIDGANPAAIQARLDVLAQRQYDWEKRDYTVSWPAPGWAGFFFEMLDRVSVTYAGTTANGVHIDWSQKKFWVHRIQMSPGPGYTGQTVFTLEEEPEIS